MMKLYYNKQFNVLTSVLTILFFKRCRFEERTSNRLFQKRRIAGGFVTARWSEASNRSGCADRYWKEQIILLFIYYELNRVFTNYFGISVKIFFMNSKRVNNFVPGRPRTILTLFLSSRDLSNFEYFDYDDRGSFKIILNTLRTACAICCFDLNDSKLFEWRVP